MPDIVAFLSWWLALSLIGLAALPLTTRVLRWLPGRGYAFSKVFGLLLVSYLLWVGAVTGMLVNDLGGILLALLLVAGLSTWSALTAGREAPLKRIKGFWQENKVHIIVVEVLFLLTFAGWTLVRAYAPDKILPAGGEKYMEIAFLNGVLNSPRFPPLDPWLSGFAISYYYFGYVMMALLTRLTAVPATVGFDLYDALLFALTAASAYGVVSSLVAAAGGRPRAAALSGLLGGLFVGGLGNLEGLFEGLYSSRALPTAFWQWLDIPDLAGSVQSGSFYPGDGWWWWRASRVLRDLDLFYKPAPYPPIDEFPFFSFLLGDNHPHKLALPFVLLCIGLALNLLLKLTHVRVEEPPAGQEKETFLQHTWRNRGEILTYAPYALALGSLGFLNTWDLPIYLILVLLAFAAGKYICGKPLALPLLGRTVLLGAGLGSSAFLLYIFFYLSFSSQAGGILPYIFPPTRLAQYLVMFGPFIFILIFFVILAVRHSGNHPQLSDAQAQPRFSWKDVLETWLWFASMVAILFLVALLGGVILLRFSSADSLPVVQSMTGGLDPNSLLLKILGGRLANPWLFLLLSAMLAMAITALLRTHSMPGSDTRHPALSPSTVFALLLVVAGLGLTLCVEFFYLRDMFGMRMNTIFKFYFQGWVLLACASAYAVWWVARFSGRLLRGIFLSIAAITVCAGLVYPVMAIASRVERLHWSPILDAAASFAGDYPQHWAAQPADWQAIQWINANLRPGTGVVPTILEAPGGGYENAGRISAFTGLPTLLGWTNHEGQWRGSYLEINRRLPDIQEIYTTPSEEDALQLLHKWKVNYLVLGETERQFIQQTCNNPQSSCSPERALAKFDRFLVPLYTQQGVTIYQVP
jgi:YYY domain-containing protein